MELSLNELERLAEDEMYPGFHASEAYALADAMLKEREVKNES